MTFSYLQQSAETEQMDTEQLNTLVGGGILLPVKIQDDYHRFEIAESGYDNQIALSPTNVKEEGIKLKITSLIEK